MIITSHATALVRMPLAGKRAKLLAEAFRALALASNNLANVAIEIASRVLESHREGELMPEAVLTERQKAALALANAAIDRSNATREAKNGRRAAANAQLPPGGEPKSPSRIFPHFGAEGSKAWNIIDISVLDQACRLHRDESGASPYEAMGSQEAPLVVASVVKAFGKFHKGEAGRPHPRASGANLFAANAAPIAGDPLDLALSFVDQSVPNIIAEARRVAAERKELDDGCEDPQTPRSATARL